MVRYLAHHANTLQRLAAKYWHRAFYTEYLAGLIKLFSVRRAVADIADTAIAIYFKTTCVYNLFGQWLARRVLIYFFLDGADVRGCIQDCDGPRNKIFIQHDIY